MTSRLQELQQILASMLHDLDVHPPAGGYYHGYRDAVRHMQHTIETMQAAETASLTYDTLDYWGV